MLGFIESRTKDWGSLSVDCFRSLKLGEEIFNDERQQAFSTLRNMVALN
jgi:hypothetical protein